MVFTLTFEPPTENPVLPHTATKRTIPTLSIKTSFPFSVGIETTYLPSK